MVEVGSDTPIALGQTLTFRANPANIHLFDRETDLAI